MWGSHDRRIMHKTDILCGDRGLNINYLDYLNDQYVNVKEKQIFVKIIDQINKRKYKILSHLLYSFFVLNKQQGLNPNILLLYFLSKNL